MADDVDNVVIQGSGELYVAAVGTTAPTSAISAPHASFLAGLVGYIGEDGVVQSINTDVSEIKAWQNGDTVRKTQTSHDVTYSFPFLEKNPITMAQYYGNSTTVDSTSHKSNIVGTELGHFAWIIDVVDGLAKVRIYIPDGQITERGDTSYMHGDATVMPVTITAYPVLGVKAIEFVDHDITVST